MFDASRIAFITRRQVSAWHPKPVYSHLLEAFAALLGYGSYAAYREAPADALEGSEFIFPDFDRGMSRLAALGVHPENVNQRTVIAIVEAMTLEAEGVATIVPYSTKDGRPFWYQMTDELLSLATRQPDVRRLLVEQGLRMFNLTVSNCDPTFVAQIDSQEPEVAGAITAAMDLGSGTKGRSSDAQLEGVLRMRRVDRRGFKELALEVTSLPEVPSLLASMRASLPVHRQEA